ncbi:hypothetical protein JCM5353_001224 [Sporobolomyces roseus]
MQPALEPQDLLPWFAGDEHNPPAATHQNRMNPFISNSHSVKSAVTSQAKRFTNHRVPDTGYPRSDSTLKLALDEWQYALPLLNVEPTMYNISRYIYLGYMDPTYYFTLPPVPVPLQLSDLPTAAQLQVLASTTPVAKFVMVQRLVNRARQLIESGSSALTDATSQSSPTVPHTSPDVSSLFHPTLPLPPRAPPPPTTGLLSAEPNVAEVEQAIDTDFSSPLVPKVTATQRHSFRQPTPSGFPPASTTTPLSTALPDVAPRAPQPSSGTAQAVVGSLDVSMASLNLQHPDVLWLSFQSDWLDDVTPLRSNFTREEIPADAAMQVDPRESISVPPPSPKPPPAPASYADVVTSTSTKRSKEYAQELNRSTHQAPGHAE